MPTLDKDLVPSSWMICSALDERQGLSTVPRSTTTGVGDVDFCRGHLDDAGLRCQESMWNS